MTEDDGQLPKNFLTQTLGYDIVDISTVDTSTIFT